MKRLEYLCFALLLSIVTSYTVLHAQDSTIYKYPLKIKLKTGAVIIGKISIRDSLNLKIQLNDGGTLEIPKSAIDSTGLFSEEFKNISSNEDIGLSLSDDIEADGRIISVNDSTLTFKTFSGIDMTIPMSIINKVRGVNIEVRNGIYFRKDPNQSHLFVMPTARPVEQGKVYFTDYYIFFPSVTVGITDFISAGVGTCLIPISDRQLLYGNIKVTVLNKSFDDNNICIAGGAELANNRSLTAYGGSLYYGLATFGSNRYDVTVGLIVPGSYHRNILLFGGEFRVSNGAKIISENYYSHQENIVVYSFGLRFFNLHSI